MSKIPRDALAFAQRVKMSQHRLFLLVEGQEHDVRFYDKLLESSPKLRGEGYVVQLGALIAVDGVAAGGKQHLLKLFEYFRSLGKLKQSRLDGMYRIIVFGLDKDLDDIVGRRRKSPHVIYSRHADIEAEIFSQWRPKKALSVALSLDAADARSFAKHVGDPLGGLAARWSDWLYLCCRAEGTGARCSVRFGGASKVNDPLYGPADSAKVARVEEQLVAGARMSAGRDRQMMQRVAAADGRGELRYFIKGKLIPGYMGQLAEDYFADRRPVSRRTFEQAVTHVALSTVRFSGDWLRHWHDQLEAL
jgi:hypothetical protein